MTTVLIVDDQPLQRFGFRMLLESNPDTEVLGEAAHGGEAVRKAAELRPDVILMDVRMPGMDGIEATRRIVANGGRSRVLILTTFDLDEYAHAALRAGASGFLLKDSPAEELLAGVRVVARGDALLDPAITRAVIEQYARAPRRRVELARRLDDLTARERDVLDLLARGLSNSEIAATASASESVLLGCVASHLRSCNNCIRANVPPGR